MRIKVIGSGAWGSALGGLFKAEEIIGGRAEARVIDTEIAVIAVKAQVLREVLERHDFGDAVIVICSKGVELKSLKLMSEVASEVLPENPIAVLSGPNFAVEIEEGLPAAATLAIKDKHFGKSLVAMLAKVNFRIYLTDDLVTTQISGAVKNVMAIACGLCDGANLGDNARAALITRGIAEIGRLCKVLGGDEKNLMSLSGIGDLMLTCTSTKSRNYSFGIKIAQQGINISEEAGVIEGYYTSKAIFDLAAKLEIDMPICNAVYKILYESITVRDAIDEILQRPQA